MAIVTARIKAKGKNFEIKVDLDEALKMKAGKGDINLALQSPGVFYDVDRGTRASSSDLESCFGTSDLSQVASKLILSGEVQKTQEFRDAEREKKIKQVVDIIVRNAVDQNNRPYTPERITRAIEEAKCHIDNRPAEQQMAEIVSKLSSILPIKVSTKRVKLIIPARFTGQLYGLLQTYKESEEWLASGNLEVVLNIPAGLQTDFYDKLNAVAHGAIQSEELSEKKP